MNHIRSSACLINDPQLKVSNVNLTVYKYEWRRRSICWVEIVSSTLHYVIKVSKVHVCSFIHRRLFFGLEELYLIRRLTNRILVGIIISSGNCLQAGRPHGF